MTCASMSSKRAKASVVPEPSITHHFADFGGSNAGSFEVRYAGGRKFFYYDDNAGRRAVGGHMTKEQALAAAQARRPVAGRASLPAYPTVHSETTLGALPRG